MTDDFGDGGGEGLDDGGGVPAGDDIGVKNWSEFGVRWDCSTESWESDSGTIKFDIDSESSLPVEDADDCLEEGRWRWMGRDNGDRRRGRPMVGVERWYDSSLEKKNPLDEAGASRK